MKFDYIVANPPYASKGNNTLWRKIMNKIKNFSSEVIYLAPSSSVGGPINWKKHKDSIISIEYLDRSWFPVGTDISIVHWRENKSEEMQMTYFDQNNKPLHEVLLKKDFPMRIPFVRMPLDEYHKVFDQSGIPWSTRVKGESGVWRPDGKRFEFTLSLPETKHMVTTCGYIPCTDAVKGKALASTLTKLLVEGKIEGEWAFKSAKFYTRLLDPIRKDLV